MNISISLVASVLFFYPFCSSSIFAEEKIMNSKNALIKASFCILADTYSQAIKTFSERLADEWKEKMRTVSEERKREKFSEVLRLVNMTYKDFCPPVEVVGEKGHKLEYGGEVGFLALEENEGVIEKDNLPHKESSFEQGALKALNNGKEIYVEHTLDKEVFLAAVKLESNESCKICHGEKAPKGAIILTSASEGTLEKHECQKHPETKHAIVNEGELVKLSLD